MGASKVVVGIVTYRSGSVLRRCLQALKRQTFPRITVKIWDNAGEDEIRTIAKSFQVPYIRSDRNLGYGGGHNALLQNTSLSDIDYYLTLNPDAVLDPAYVSSVVHCARTQSAGSVTGKLYKDKNNLTLYSVGHAIFRDGYAFNIGYGMKDQGQYEKSKEIFGVPGAAALYSGAMIHALSRCGRFFDPDLFMYYEDIDVDWRGQLRGFSSWYTPRAIALHPGGVAPKILEGDILANRFITIMKNATAQDLVMFNFPHMFLHILFRLVTTPRVGWHIVKIVGKNAKRACQFRATATGVKMKTWFQAAHQEASSQPLSIASRLSQFFSKYV